MWLSRVSPRGFYHIAFVFKSFSIIVRIDVDFLRIMISKERDTQCKIENRQAGVFGRKKLLI